MTGKHKRVEPAAETDNTTRIPPYLDPAEPATGPTDISLTKAAAEAADRDADTGPQSRRLEAAVETTQVMPALIDNRLRAAAHLLRARGICRTDLIDIEGRIDVIGALALTLGFTEADLAKVHMRRGDGWAEPVYHDVNELPELRHLAQLVAASDGELGIRPVITVSWWVDHQCFDDADLLGLLDRAADSYAAVAT